MKTLRLLAGAVIAMTVATLLYSCGESYPTAYVAVGYPGTEIKEEALAEAANVAHANYGEIFKIISKPADGFVKVRNIATGVEGFLDTLQISHQIDSLRTPELLEAEPDEAYLIHIETNDEWESTSGWALWLDGQQVKAMKTSSIVYATGMMRDYQTYYKGEAKEGYILLTEQIEPGEESGIRLDVPIIIWEDIANTAGIFENGSLFTPGGQLFAGDDSEWGI